MARSRNIKPGFFRNEEIAELAPLAQLLFIGLWCLADREGRLEDRPKRIEADLFPYTDVNIEGMLKALDSVGFIHRYQTDGHKCIQITNFKKHQRPHNKELPSTIPPAPTQVEPSTNLNRAGGEPKPPLTLNPFPSKDTLTPNREKLSPPVEKSVDKKEGVDKPKRGKEEFDIVLLLSEDDLTKAKGKASGWDIYALARIYNQNIRSGRMEMAKSPPKAFPAWCEKYTKGNLPQ